MITHELMPVEIPSHHNWGAEKDVQAVMEILGEDWDLPALHFRNLCATWDMSEVLRHALHYYGRDVDPNVQITVPELIDMTETAVRESAPSQEYLERLLDELAACRHAYSEYIRVTAVYSANRDLNWLFPLADLGDWLVSATLWLLEAMVCEHDDFAPCDENLAAIEFGYSQELPEHGPDFRRVFLPKQPGWKKAS